MNRSLRVAVAAIALFAASAASSQATLVFNFSFSNTIGNVNGTVTGRILGLSDNSTGAASQVLIDTFPVGLVNVAGAPPINPMFWDQQYQNSFTTVGGQVVSGSFHAQQTIGTFSQGYQLYIGAGPTNFLNLDGVDRSYVWNQDGFDISTKKISAHKRKK